ncbi:MAG: polyphosphate polymerase domain-containing protein [Chitinophagales bacterium]|nr:polyphosphate polymerase domain-containing protein [Bacteroidota bacterium]MCB9043517.1 polyphosphate polymerase domain-containing protein [Chitinophagales bacterium]
MKDIQASLNNFLTIDLTEINRVALLNRVDTKYLLHTEEFMQLLPTLSEAYNVLAVNKRNIIPYQNLYFDTPDYENYLQHHNKNGNRYKVRYRQYTDTGVCFLESKYKTNTGRTQKKRLAVQEISKHLPEKNALLQLPHASNSYKPMLYVNFYRITMADKAFSERATFDMFLEYATPQMAHLPLVILKKWVIVELKQDKIASNSILLRHLKQQHIRPQTFSKYCVGMALTNTALKRNRFKALLQKIV